VLFDKPLVQPLFFLAVVGFFISLRLVRPSNGPAVMHASGG